MRRTLSVLLLLGFSIGTTGCFNEKAFCTASNMRKLLLQTRAELNLAANHSEKWQTTCSKLTAKQEKAKLTWMRDELNDKDISYFSHRCGFGRGCKRKTSFLGNMTSKVSTGIDHICFWVSVYFEEGSSYSKDYLKDEINHQFQRIVDEIDDLHGEGTEFLTSYFSKAELQKGEKLSCTEF